MSSIGTASPRPRTLRLVRPDDRPISRGRTDLRTRRTLALLLGWTAFLVGSGLVMVLSASSVSAFAEYGDPTAWRALAAFNEIDDPLRVPTGRVLLLPTPEVRLVEALPARHPARAEAGEAS